MAQSQGYYVPHGSNWPIVGAIGLFLLMLGLSTALNGVGAGPAVAWTGAIVIIVMVVGWFATVIRESEGGVYNQQVDRSFRMGMTWFIISEVMFFAAFFGALFYARQMAVPWLGGESNNFFTNLLLYPGYENAWPTNGPKAIGGDYQVMAALGLPAINTAILLTSGVTITIAHHALKDNNRKVLGWGLFATFMLGFLFVSLQAYEYIHAYQEMNLKLSTGIYGSTFFMLTGFHGLHVTLGAIMLVVIWARCLKGHFTPTHHFGFEAVAWYWHFVDVVWLGLYIFVYWL
ncbi:MAG: cytochrome c oxidase subunit 3 [Chromatiales bacterium]|jgi:cytochrome c oxidase subunit 3|nr:cytochrome c oxidase subunit 3 [Chromatiales bacterium]